VNKFAPIKIVPEAPVLLELLEPDELDELELPGLPLQAYRINMARAAAGKTFLKMTDIAYPPYKIPD
jgi:hypothetical protein